MTYEQMVDEARAYFERHPTAGMLERRREAAACGMVTIGRAPALAPAGNDNHIRSGHVPIGE